MVCSRERFLQSEQKKDLRYWKIGRIYHEHNAIWLKWWRHYPSQDGIPEKQVLRWSFTCRITLVNIFRTNNHREWRKQDWAREEVELKVSANSTVCHGAETTLNICFELGKEAQILDSLIKEPLERGWILDEAWPWVRKLFNWGQAPQGLSWDTPMPTCPAGEEMGGSALAGTPAWNSTAYTTPPRQKKGKRREIYEVGKGKKWELKKYWWTKMLAMYKMYNVYTVFNEYSI